MTEEQKLEELTVVYLGKREAASGKTVHLFIPENVLTEQLPEAHGIFSQQDVTDALDRKASWYILKSFTGTIGARYKTEGLVEGDKIRTLATSKMQWLSGGTGLWETYTEAWRTMARDVELRKRAKSAEKNADTDPAMTRAVAVLKDRYQKIPGGYRRGFMLWLQDELMKR